MLDLCNSCKPSASTHIQTQLPTACDTCAELGTLPCFECFCVMEGHK